jgi:hypothetical protein
VNDRISYFSLGGITEIWLLKFGVAQIGGNFASFLTKANVCLPIQIFDFIIILEIISQINFFLLNLL